MAVIYLQKGEARKVAIAEEEAMADEKKGWKRYEVKDPPMDRAKMRAEEQAAQERWLQEQSAKRAGH